LPKVNKLLGLFLLLGLTAFGQQRHTMYGRVIAGNAAVIGIFIINKATGEETKTGAGGTFSIPVTMGDRLTVYSDRIEVRDFLVTENTFKEQPYVMEVNYKGTELEEVVVTGVTSESLGLVPKGQKRYTDKDRKMAGASSKGLQYLVDAITGQLAVKRRKRETINKETLGEEIDATLTDTDLEGFGLPRDKARAFIYYAVQDDRVVQAFKAGNAQEAKLVLIELIPGYLKLQDSNE
jgi:hypothetical protein